ncbi:c-type cytochrome biogenesis protein CcsB [Streptomyces sp. NPDC005438]|uniref:c-type cytochrome biogenesis protein CcsB n=1 Tax=Streptomyces sp. NPDC005438 TaxID=3156880 RepID=UPI0033B897B6
MNIAAAVNENLAETSNYLVYSAMAVYTLAFVAHLAEWVLGTRSKVGRTAAALTVDQVTGADQERTAPDGPAVTVRKGGGTEVIERPTVVTRSSAGSRPDVPDGPGAAGGSEKGDLYGRVAVSLTTLAFLLHAGGVLTRALSVQRAPWGNMYEFSTTFSMVAVAAYLGFLAAGKNIRWLGLPLVTTVLLDLGLAVTVLYTASDQLVPALDSYWLWIHVSCAIICGAVFYLGAVGSLFFLLRDRYEARRVEGHKVSALNASIMDRLPAAATLDKFAYRVNALVFPLWTFTIIAGAIWAEAAWGRYWGWDPKEVWSFITWVGYATYLHARATAGWKGRKAAYLALVAFGCFLFNYYGVNIFVDSKHSYSGT